MLIDSDTRRRIRLSNDSAVQLRLIGLEDRERFIAGFERLSPESRYRRFFMPVSRLKDEVIDRLLDTDNVDHLAVGADLLGRDGRPVGPIVGVARYIRLRDDPDCAEAAVTVADDLQHLGLGRALLQMLTEAAVERGVHRFRAHVQPDNGPVMHMLSNHGTPLHQSADGPMLVYEYALPNAPDDPVSNHEIYDILRISARAARRTIDLAGHLPWVRKRISSLSELTDELETIAKGGSLDVSQSPVDIGEDESRTPEKRAD